jgi:subtilisin-like proprotein convertase family protein
MAALGGLILYASLAGAHSPGRDPSAHLLLVPDSAAAEAALNSSDVRVVAAYEEFTLVEARGGDEADLRAAGASRRDDLREISLPGSPGIDPLAERESLAAKGVPEPGEALVLVQFVGPIKDAWLERLRATGARVVEYVAQNGYVVHADGEEVDRLAALVGSYPAVRAVTPVRAGDKVSEGAAGTGLVAVQTLAGAEGADARREAAAAGERARPTSTVRGLSTQYLRLSAAEVEALAADPAVVSVTPSSPPRLLDERASQIAAGNLSGFGPAGPSYLSWHDARPGANSFDFAIDFTDEGLDNGSMPNPGHDDFRVNGSGASRIAYSRDYTNDNSSEDCGGHGTNVASIAAGYNAVPSPPPPNLANDFNDDAGYNYGLGVAPRIEIGASKVFACDGGALLDPPMVTADAYDDDARISNNSWGNSDEGTYSADSRDYDAFVRDAHGGTAGNQQMVEVFAAGNEGNREPGAANEGYATINSPGTAKNVITVGASENVRGGSGADDGCGVGDAGANNAWEIADFSSRGPTNDLRQKPDLVAPGTHMVGASPQHGGYVGNEACTDAFPAGNAFYSLISGTSQAAAVVSGAAALVRDDWQDEHGGAAPSPALTKAILINSATDLAGGSDGKGGITGSAPNADQGWGRVNAGAAVGPAPRQYLDQSVRLDTTGQSHRVGYGVLAPSGRVKVTLVWTDPPGATGPNPTLVNDLDLEVAAGGRRYLGNVLAGGVSRTGGSADRRNNVESVVLPTGTSGRFTVEVTAANLPGDGVPQVGDASDQDFALVVSNAAPAASSPHLTEDATSIGDPRPGGDGDGALEPGESVSISERLRNDGAATAAAVSGTLMGAGGLTVSQGGSAFPNAAPAATTTSQSAFTAALSGSAVCGADVPATLSITTSGNPTQAVPLTLPTGAAGAATSSASGTLSQAIPDDNSGGAVSSLAVTGSGRIKDVDVSIAGITHGWVGDLALELRHPDGTTVELMRHPGGPDNGGDNLSGTVFDDEAAANVSQASAPYAGRFRPQNDQLSRFDGKDKKGTWSLRVKDLFEGDIGILRGWGMSNRAAVCDFGAAGGGGSISPAPTVSAPSFAIAPVEERLADALARRLTILGACASACRGDAKLSVSGKAARSLGLTKRRSSRPVSIGKGSGRRRSAGQLSYRISLTKRARAALRGEERVTAAMSVVVAVDGGPDVKLKSSLRLRSRAGLSSVARNGLRVRAACSRTCHFEAGLYLSPRTARKLGLKAKGSKTIRVASRRASVSTRGRELKLKMARPTRAAAARQKRMSLTLRAVAGASSGPTRKASRTLTLRR